MIVQTGKCTDTYGGDYISSEAVCEAGARDVGWSDTTADKVDSSSHPFGCVYYDDDDPWQIKTKRAAIIVGGQILSRGLTIEGLCVSFFGRTARMPMGDTVLQMGRWFGHKKSYIDLISIYIQDGIRVLFRDIADADKHLRVQIKDAIIRNLRPDEILLELRNSRQFRATSPSKSRFVNFDNAMHQKYTDCVYKLST